MGNCKQRKRFLDKELLYVQSESGKLSLFALALPLFVTYISEHLIGLLQTMLASRYEEGFFVIPISIASSPATCISCILGMISSGNSILLSIALGKGDKKKGKELYGSAFIALTGLSFIILPLAFIFAEQIIRLMATGSQDYDIYISYAVTYLRWRIVAAYVAAVYNVMNGVLQCYGYTKAGFIAAIVRSVGGVLLTAIALFWIKLPKEYGAHAFGVVSLISAFLSVIIFVIITIRKEIGISFKLNLNFIKKIFAIGAPASVSLIFYTLSQTVTTSICMKLSDTAFLAKNYVVQIVYFVYQLGFAVGQAAAIMVGRLCGMGDLDKADRFTKQNYRIVVGLNLIFSLVCFIFAKPLVSLCFNASEDVLSYVPLVMFIDVIVECGRGMNHVGQNSLNATGDVKFTTVVSIVSCWVCSVGLAYLLGIVCNFGIYGIWAAFAVDELFRGILYCIRWNKERWRDSFKKETSFGQNAKTIS